MTQYKISFCTVLLLLTVTTSASIPELKFDPDGEWDWVQLDTGEWLKGTVKGMYDNDLEFDSDHFGIITISWNDIAQLHTTKQQKIRIRNPRKSATDNERRGSNTTEGRISMEGGILSVASGDDVTSIGNDQILSILPDDVDKADRWTSRISVGTSFLSGNNDRSDFNAQMLLQRRTISTRLVASYLSNYSQSEDVEIANNHRVTGYYDYFMSDRFFIRPIGLEYYKDPFQNIANRITTGGSLGYSLIDNSQLVVDLSAGPAVQYIEFETVQGFEDEGKTIMAGIAQIKADWEISSELDYLGTLGLQYAPSSAGGLSLHFNNRFRYDLPGNIDLESSLIWDRISEPIPDALGRVPAKDDFRLIFGLSLEL